MLDADNSAITARHNCCRRRCRRLGGFGNLQVWPEAVSGAPGWEWVGARLKVGRGGRAVGDGREVFDFVS